MIKKSISLLLTFTLLLSGAAATLSLLCEERGSISEEPQVQIKSDRPVTVEIYWDEGQQSKTVTVSGN